MKPILSTVKLQESPGRISPLFIIPFGVGLPIPRELVSLLALTTSWETRSSLTKVSVRPGVTVNRSGAKKVKALCCVSTPRFLLPDYPSAWVLPVCLLLVIRLLSSISKYCRHADIFYIFFLLFAKQLYILVSTHQLERNFDHCHH